MTDGRLNLRGIVENPDEGKDSDDKKAEWKTPQLVVESVASVTQEGVAFDGDGTSGS